jgi:hypothetical protein
MTDIITNKSRRVSGWEARQYVQNLQPFRNNSISGDGPKDASLWGEWMTFADDSDPLYVVYSYRRTWPLWANWKGVWFGNTDKFSRTTTKHYSQTHPHKGFVGLSKIDMEFLVLFRQPDAAALVEAAKLKLLPEALIPEVAAIRMGVE